MENVQASLILMHDDGLGLEEIAAQTEPDRRFVRVARRALARLSTAM